MTVTLITGAASGLGWAMAQYWYRQGHCLVLVDRDEDGLERCRQTLTDAKRVLAVTADITSSADIERLLLALETTFGRLDLLVNNAGITHRSVTHRTDPAVFRQVMAVDWQATVELTLALLPLLQQSRGDIVTIGSMAGWMPVPGRAGYCAAKGALGQFFEVLRLELEPMGIHLLMVYPSFLSTAIERNALGADGGPARHPRSTAGGVTGAETMAAGIARALANRRRWLLPDRLSRFASLLWRLAPSLYLRLIGRRFAGDLE